MEFSSAADTITPGQPIRDGETLISSSQRFELGFFSPGNSNNRYLGIWYYTISPKAVVWVANRNIPIDDKSGVLTVLNGNLHGEVPVIQPPGNFTLRLEKNGVPQLVISTPSKKVARSGPWNGFQFNGIPMMHNLIVKPDLVHNEDESYYMYDVFSDTVLTRLILDPSGSIQRLIWDEGNGEWNRLYSWPYDICDHHAECGANGNCRIGKTGLWTPICECLKGFVPNSEEGDTTQTKKCVKKSSMESECRNGEGFLKLVRMKVPDSPWLNESMNIQECQAECLKNCACSAFSNLDIRGKGSGCLMWFGDLTDMKECSEGFTWGQDIFIRVPASELELVDQVS
ncbi:hypothetical protein Pint_04374 [Pistacia integerrima]|uniref:Uncharacterized protein n=1 Tax=Pistacia integerrima TaxID=434235 RepID=A0ACC0Z781_9ROSI|nr:hypothetical protein Pint_04374 [Pistacia integerrima]